MARTMRVEISNPSHETGEWIYASLDMPASENEIKDALQRARLSDATTYREYRIYNCDHFPMLSDNQLDTTTLEELNFLARRLDSLDETERKVLKAITPRVLKGMQEGNLVSVKDLINLTYGLDKVSVAENVHDFVELGELAIESEALKWIENVPEEEREFLDRYRIGRQVHDIDGGAFVEGIYVVASEYRFQEIYDGEELPVEGISIPLRETAFRLELVKEPTNETEDVVETNNWLGLPIDKEEANERAKDYDHERIEDCVYLGFESSVPQIDSSHFGDMHDFDKLNCLAEMMLQMSPSDQVKFKAVLSAEEPQKIEEILDVARNLDRYEIATQIEYPYQFFKSYMVRHMDATLDARWLDTVFSRREGEELLKRLGAKQTPYGIVSARDKGLYEPVSRYESTIQHEKYDVIEINGQQALFVNEMVDAKDVPVGLYKYDLRGEGDTPFETIEPYVLVNRSGTILVKEPFDFNGKDHICLTEETNPNFLGIEATPQEFLDGNYEQDEVEELEPKLGGV